MRMKKLGWFLFSWPFILAVISVIAETIYVGGWPWVCIWLTIVSVIYGAYLITRAEIKERK